MRTSLILTALMLAACANRQPSPMSLATGGDPQRGVAHIARYGCGSCHTIGGITSAHGLIGPALNGVRNRLYIAGMLHNEPDNLIHWIRDPKSVNPHTAMPVLGLSQRDAADIAAYLYSQ